MFQKETVFFAHGFLVFYWDTVTQGNEVTGTNAPLIVTTLPATILNHRVHLSPR